MRIINSIRSYILEEEFKLTFLNNRINIVNYESIGHFDNNRVLINYNDGQVVIKGKSLVVSKLMNNEILIEGKIINIEFR